jgi:hypothetical protein
LICSSSRLNCNLNESPSFPLCKMHCIKCTLYKNMIFSKMYSCSVYYKVHSNHIITATFKCNSHECCLSQESPSISLM